MGWYDKQSEEYEAHEAVLHLSILNLEISPSDHVPSVFQVTKRKADLSHELLAGAASFYAAKKYEDHVAEKGKPDDHALAKELM
ncbi:hypothetical protein BDM02DRAFT_3109663 [Thelephora ganbajun]|uniref:Uncharacterized protein n=1 Tax=Thelephora ganbajun TaxID=370292 RepID=A0ACB6ZSD4_THEGA|nr:hypothetical protein BDM02DRAFT_3109663 [Thelephora ganbajun]